MEGLFRGIYQLHEKLGNRLQVYGITTLAFRISKINHEHANNTVIHEFMLAH